MQNNKNTAIEQQFEKSADSYATVIIKSEMDYKELKHLINTLINLVSVKINNNNCNNIVLFTSWSKLHQTIKYFLTHECLLFWNSFVNFVLLSFSSVNVINCNLFSF